MSPPSIVLRKRPRSFPRVSGDEPMARELTARGWEFSPRERG